MTRPSDWTTENGRLRLRKTGDAVISEARTALIDLRTDMCRELPHTDLTARINDVLRDISTHIGVERDEPAARAVLKAVAE